MTKKTKESGNYRWRILALLFFATTINYIDRQVIGILKPFIADDLGWGEADYGYIVTAFQIAYAIGLITTGRFLDKYGTRIGVLVVNIYLECCRYGTCRGKGGCGIRSRPICTGYWRISEFSGSSKKCC